MKQTSFKEQLAFGILHALGTHLNEAEAKYAVDIHAEYERIQQKESHLSANARRDVVQAYLSLQDVLKKD